MNNFLQTLKSMNAKKYLTQNVRKLLERKTEKFGTGAAVNSSNLIGRQSLSL